MFVRRLFTPEPLDQSSWNFVTEFRADPVGALGCFPEFFGALGSAVFPFCDGAKL